MASFIESQPVFESRLKASGLTTAIYDEFKAQNIVSLSQLAFISSYTPGGADEAPLIAVFEKVIDREASVAERASFRRLFHEAFAAVTTEMRQTIEKAEETSSRRLTQPERADRYQEQSKRLVGISIKGHLEPSDHLIDICCGIYEENRLKYVEWSKCTSRESELQSDQKKDASFTLDSTTGKLKVETKTSSEQADTSSEILLQYALTRRSLAMDQANIIEFNKMQVWTDRLIRARIEEAPPGFSKPTFRQLQSADQKMFMELADQTRSGIQTTGAGRPVEAVFEAVINSTAVTCLMQPMPGAAVKSQFGGGDKQDSDPNKWRPSPYKGKGKGKEKGKSRMPAELIGCRSHTNGGLPICYGFNLGTCKEEVQNGKCSRGMHVCAVPKCGKHHPATKCPNFKAASS